MKQKEFNKVFYAWSKSDLDKEKAWQIYVNFNKIIKNKDSNMIEYLERIASLPKKDLLKWRTRLAEKGIELTPDQVIDYVFILSLAIMDTWDLT